MRNAIQQLLVPSRSTALRAAPHADAGRLVTPLYGHPDESRARDRLDLAFAADGNKDPAVDERLGHNSATSRD